MGLGIPQVPTQQVPQTVKPVNSLFNPVSNGVVSQLANNPLLNNLQKVGAAKNMLNNHGTVQDLERLLAGNPLLEQVKAIGAQYGGDYAKAFTETAKQAGISPDTVLNQLKQSGLI